MRRTLLLGAALMLAGPPMIASASAGGAGVPQMGWAKSAAVGGSIVDKAGYHCWKWSNKCALRWGPGSPRFYRCLWRHGC